MNKRIGLAIAGIAAAAVMAGGTAYGAVSSSSIPDASGLIHGCYSTNAANGTNGTVLNIINTGQASCSKGQSAISWNQAGPAGPQGPPGAAGTPGPAGPSTAGPAGLDIKIVIVWGAGQALAECPADHPYLTGGGAYYTSPSGESANSGIVFDGAQTWYVAAENNTDTVAAQAFCAK